MHRSLLTIVACSSLLVLAATGHLSAADTTPPPPAAATPAAATPFLGVRFDENSVALDQEPGMPINEVVTGSTAQLLGLEAGDRLITVNSKPVEKPDDLKAVLGGAKVGDTITVESSRKGKPTTATGILAERPKPAAIKKEVDQLAQKLAEVKELAAAQKREPSLAEILQQLKDIETGLPRAVAAFKKQYPNGDFDIRIQVVITSDRTAAHPIELSNLPPKPADGKPADSKPADSKPADGKPAASNGETPAPAGHVAPSAPTPAEKK